MKLSLFVVVFSGCLFALGAVAYSNDRFRADYLSGHPYQFVPPYGHASQTPGSPKHFVPGYGYRILGFGFRAGFGETLNAYPEFYEFGQRKHQPYEDSEYRFWGNQNGGPWFYPGWPANVRTRW